MSPNARREDGVQLAGAQTVSVAPSLSWPSNQLTSNQRSIESSPRTLEGSIGKNAQKS